jgi:hypothetical protein
MSPTSQWGSSSRSAFLVWGRTKARWRLRLTHDICDSCRMSWQTLQIIRSHPRNAPWGRTWRRFWKQCRWCRPRSGEAHLVLCASLQPFLFFFGPSSRLQIFNCLYRTVRSDGKSVPFPPECGGGCARRQYILHRDGRVCDSICGWQVPSAGLCHTAASPGARKLI